MIIYRQRWEKVGKFYGTYKRNLDEKKRLQVPAKLIPDETSNLIAIRGFEGCLSIYSEEGFAELEAKLSAYDFFQTKARKLVRKFFSSRVDLSLDSHGRISLGEELSRQYNLNSSVVLIGVGNHFEIWDEETYREYEEGDDSLEELAELLSQVGEK